MIPELTEQGFPPESIARMLVNELRAAPQLRELVLRELLTEDFLGLPRRVEQLEATVAELRDEVTTRMDGFSARMDGFSARMDGFSTRMDGMQNDITELRRDTTELRRDTTGLRRDTTELRRDTTDLRRDTTGLRRDMNLLTGRVGNMLGESYETRCSEDIELVLVDYVDKPILHDRDDIRVALVQARRNGVISRVQFDRVRVADIIADGVDLDSGQPILVVMEASITINESDVNAAHERAALLRVVVGGDTRPFCVANVQWSDDLAKTAGQLGVTLIHYELPNFSGG